MQSLVIRVFERIQRSAGLTLVELLMAMAILGILATAIFALTGGVLNFSRKTTVVNELLADLNDAAGYLAINGRGAMDVAGATDSIRIKHDGSEFDCATGSADGACMALLVPIVNRDATASISGYELRAFRIMPLSAWTADPGLAPGWNGADTPLMLEYRIPLACGSPCAAPPAIPPLVTASQASLVISDLYLLDNAGNEVEPFTAIGSAGTQLIFTLRLRGSGSESGRMVPADGPLSISVTRRPPFGE